MLKSILLPITLTSQILLPIQACDWYWGRVQLSISGAISATCTNTQGWCLIEPRKNVTGESPVPEGCDERQGVFTSIVTMKRLYCSNHYSAKKAMNIYQNEYGLFC